MRTKFLIGLALATATLGVPLTVGAVALAERPAGHDLAYGSDPLQRLDFYPAQNAHGPAPLIVFVHGGGWKRGDKDSATGEAKIRHFTGKGYALASIDYRLVPNASVEQQASDVAHALSWLIRDAGRLGIDPSRIVLMGHSAGAQLAALVGTDPRYLQGAGLGFGNLRGVVLLDGAAYDVPEQIRIGAPIMRQTYYQAFGRDPARERALSATFEAAGPNAPSFLVLHVQRPDGILQSEQLTQALRASGTRVEIDGFPGQGLRGHMQINNELGEPSYPATSVTDRWLASVLR